MPHQPTQGRKPRAITSTKHSSEDYSTTDCRLYAGIPLQQHLYVGRSQLREVFSRDSSERTADSAGLPGEGLAPLYRLRMSQSLWAALLIQEDPILIDDELSDRKFAPIVRRPGIVFRRPFSVSNLDHQPQSLKSSGRSSEDGDNPGVALGYF